MNVKAIKNCMKEKKMSAYRLAKKAGLPNTTVCEIVNGKIQDPHVMTVKKIADILGVKIDDLL